MKLVSAFFIAIFAFLSINPVKSSAVTITVEGIKSSIPYVNDDTGTYEGDSYDHIWVNVYDDSGNSMTCTGAAQAWFDECTGEWGLI